MSLNPQLKSSGRKYFLALAISFVSCLLFSQNRVDIWSDGILSTDPSSILSINSDNKGILIPRMSASEKSMISDPANGLMVYQTDGITGFYYYSENYWEKVQDKTEVTPIGMVIEWWRPNANFPLPDGYAICDGSLVTDVASPLYNSNLPNLIDNFVKGVTDTTLIGTTESGIHTHQFDPPNVSLGSAGEHSHNLSFTVVLNGGGHSHTIDQGVVLSSSSSHNHIWSQFYRDSNQFPVPDDFYWESGDNVLMMNWIDGMDGAGSDYFTLGTGEVTSGLSFYTDTDSHNHSLYGTVNHSGSHDHDPMNISPVVSTSGNHIHDIDIPIFSSSQADEKSPPFYGLVKIIKIK